MTAAITSSPVGTMASLRSRLDTPLKRAAAYSLVAFALVSLVRVLAGADAMTSSNTIRFGLAAAAPILLAGLGGLVSERSGTVNIGLDGMIILGAWFAAWAGWHFGVWWAIPAGVVGGALGGLLLGFVTLQFGVNHVVAGIAINLIAPGVTRFLSGQFFVGHADGSISNSPTMKGSMGSFTMPLLSGGDVFGWKSPDVLGWLDDHRWFLVSDVAGFARGMTYRIAWTTMFALVALALVWYLLWRTPLGLRMRSAGEKPSATDSLGVSVLSMRYLGCVLSGALAGGAGAWLAIDVRAYQEGQAGGRGFLGLAALVFGNWQAIGVMAGASLFGYVQALANLADTDPIRAVFLLVAVVVGALAILQWRRRLPITGAFLAVAATALLWFFIVTEQVNAQLVYVMPYVVTLTVLTVASQRLRPPAADGQIWYKDSSG